MAFNLQRLIGSQAYDDLCQKFAEEAVYGKSGLFPNAITAWTNQSKQQVSGLSGIQPGDLVYFSPNQGNGMNGHVGIYKGNNQFVSATDNGVRVNDLGQWAKSTGQQILGYIPTSNPQLKSQLSTLQGGIANNSQLDLTSANPTVTNQDQLQQSSQDYLKNYQGAQDAANWFGQYQKQQAQQEIPQMPHQATAYAPSTTIAQPTSAENWLRQYTG